MNTRTAAQGLRLFLGIVLLSGLVLGDVNPTSAAQRCYVKADAIGLNNGSSWTNAFTDLQSALGGSSCTEVWVAKGTYKPTSGTGRTVSFALKNGVSIYGGFAGTETGLNQRNHFANPTILSGEIGSAGIADNSYHVVDGTNTNNTALLDGFAITAGNSDGSGGWPHFVGGGLLNNPGSPRLVNLTFSNNKAIDNGGAMFNWMSSPTLTNVIFSNNVSDASGGAMRNDDGSQPILTGVIFIGNSAVQGGGMANSASTPTLKGVTFSGNSVSTSGGGLLNFQSSPSLMNVTFNGNTAVEAGGGIYNDTSSPSLTNVTFSENSAVNGGGIYNTNTSNPTIRNSILFGDIGGEIINSGGQAAVSFSIVQGGFPGTGNLNADPRLKPLGNYGGFTQTMALGRGSPAIDKGTNAGCPGTDQRGIARPKDGDGNGTAICDMGATEGRFLTSTFNSIAAQDGWILESTETRGIGGTLDASQETISVGDYSAAKKQARGILSFNTAGLPDLAVVTKATLKVKGAGVVGLDPFLTLGNLLVDVRKGAFSNNAALQLVDFQAPASKNSAMSIKNNPVGGWYSATMVTNLGYINKQGLTQLRLRFTLHDNNDPLSNYIRFYSGNCPVAGKCLAADRPKLTINYYIP